MSTTVTYKGSTLTTVDNQTHTLKTAGKYMEDDVILTDVSSSGGSVTQDQDGFIILPPTGGGGGSSYTLLAEQDMEISTTSTSETTEGSIQVNGITDIRESGEKIIFISIFDKAGARNGYYYGSLSYSCRVNALAGTSYYKKANGTVDYASISYGVYPTISNNTVSIRSKFTNSFGTLNGTFNIRVYTIDFPTGVDPF